MPRRSVAAVFLVLQLGSLLGCAFRQAYPNPIFGYRLIDDQTLNVLASTDTGYEVWVGSVVETPTTVTVDVRYRVTQSYGGMAGVARDIWLTVPLEAPLGERKVLDAITNTPVEMVPQGP